MPKIYFDTEQPTTPEQGDLRVLKATNVLQEYSGSSWAAPRFTTLTIDSGGLTISSGGAAVTGDVDITSGRLAPAAGFASNGAATPGWYIPGAAGAPAGAIASLGGRVALYYDTTGNRLWFRHGGSFYAGASLVLGG